MVVTILLRLLLPSVHPAGFGELNLDLDAEENGSIFDTLSSLRPHDVVTKVGCCSV